MIARKTLKADLERYRSIFFLTGLAVSLLLVISVMNIKVYDKPTPKTYDMPVRIVPAEDIPITYRQLPSTVPPPVTIEQIVMVENDMMLDVELDLLETETDEHEVVHTGFDANAPVGEEGVKYVAYEDEASDEILSFEIVESVPVFPGCEGASENTVRKRCFHEKMLLYVKENFRYPEKALEMRIEGKVFVGFVIEKDGTVTDITVLRGVDPLLDREAVRVISGLPKISPATQRGKPVRMRFVMPISAIMANI